MTVGSVGAGTSRGVCNPLYSLLQATMMPSIIASANFARHQGYLVGTFKVAMCMWPSPALFINSRHNSKS